jgi:hypothetical protein
MARALILDELNNKTKSIYPINYSIIKIEDKNRQAIVSEILPFRVKFIPIQIESLLGNPPGIGLQVIGYSNYIL